MADGENVRYFAVLWYPFGEVRVGVLKLNDYLRDKIIVGCDAATILRRD
jgi:hypothetical protein